MSQLILWWFEYSIQRHHTYYSRSQCITVYMPRRLLVPLCTYVYIDLYVSLCVYIFLCRCVSMYHRVFVYVVVSLSLYVLIYWSECRSLCFYVSLSICLSWSLCVQICICLHVSCLYVSLYPLVSISICLCVSLSLYVYMHLDWWGECRGIGWHHEEVYEACCCSCESPYNAISGQALWVQHHVFQHCKRDSIWLVEGNPEIQSSK